MSDFYINTPDQFEIKDNILYGLSHETYQQLFTLPKDIKIHIQIKDLDITKIEHNAFDISPENTILIDNVCELIITNLPKLEKICIQAFEQIGQNYEDIFIFELSNCPNLKIIKDSAFESVAAHSSNIFNQEQEPEFILKFPNCENLKILGSSCFSYFGYEAQNAKAIGLGGPDSNLKIIEDETFCNTFHNSPLFDYIDLSISSCLRRIEKSAFEGCGENSTLEVLIDFQCCYRLKYIKPKAFYNIGKNVKLVCDLSDNNTIAHFSNEAFNSKNLEFIPKGLGEALEYILTNNCETSSESSY